MPDEPLSSAFRALREATDGHSDRAEATLDRVLATTAKHRRSRARSPLLIPLAAILVGSSAWAASSGRLTSAWKQVTQLMAPHESSRRTEQLAGGQHPRTSPGSVDTGGAENNVAEANGDEADSDEANGAEANGDEADSAEANGDEADSVETDGVDTNRPELKAADSKDAESKAAKALKTPTRPPTPSAAAPSAAAPSAAAPQASTPQAHAKFAANPTPQPPHKSERQTANTQDRAKILAQDKADFEAAYRAHESGASHAVAAWDEYLKRHPTGRFVPEARYARAVALVRAGRTAEARAALLPFAKAPPGSYRRTDARRLLEMLESTR